MTGRKDVLPHRTKKNQRNDEHSEKNGPQPGLLSKSEVQLIPGQLGHHIVEGDLIGGSHTDQRDDKRKVQQEDAKLAKSLRVTIWIQHDFAGNYLVGVLVRRNERQNARLVALNQEVHAVVHPEGDYGNENDGRNKSSLHVNEPILSHIQCCDGESKNAHSHTSLDQVSSRLVVMC